MPQQPIPDRVPISDSIHGVISQFDNQYVFSIQPLATVVPIAEGDFIVRYGIPYLGKPFYSIVPDLVVVDYGDMLVGEDAWQFLIRQSNLYPRSDVLGYRNDGKDEMLVVKQLDFALPFDVLVFKTSSDRQPLLKLSAVLGRYIEELPERFLSAIPQFETLAEWQASDE